MSKYALLSVTDKKGIGEFGKDLEQLGYTILSTGGTAKELRGAGVNVMDVSSYTGSNEILNGRVKTLHPKVHGAILYDRENQDHVDQIKQLEIGTISVVVVNLYKFAENAVKADLSLEQAIEHIDIGGPCMLRASAKNWEHVISVCDPLDYSWVIEKLQTDSINKEDRLKLAKKTFELTSNYDLMISNYMGSSEQPKLELEKKADLRYGENPHQKASFYSFKGKNEGFSDVEIIQGKELSYNNFIDLDGACGLIREFHNEKAVTIIKHTNPCGTAIALENDKLLDVWQKALSGDPKSAFGGIVATNQKIDKETAEAMSAIFLECIAAPGFTTEALEVFAKKKNLRVLRASWLTTAPESEPYYRSIQGGILLQNRDPEVKKTDAWKCVTQKRPTTQEENDLVFAFKVASHVKSNTIVYARNCQTITVGAGQMSRIDAAEFAAEKAKEEGKTLDGAVLASDAFFPFKDCVELAAKYGISSIIQPGGSIRDQESIDACNSHNISMLFTGERHFRH